MGFNLRTCGSYSGAATFFLDLSHFQLKKKTIFILQTKKSVMITKLQIVLVKTCVVHLEYWNPWPSLDSRIQNSKYNSRYHLFE